MKYLAILKDSFREALDTKVFYVMAAMSLLLIVTVASVSFTPLPAEDAFPYMVQHQQFHLVYPDHGRSLIPRFFPLTARVSNIEALTDAGEPQTRDYRFTLTVQDWGNQGLAQAVAFWDGPAPEDLGKEPVPEKAGPNAAAPPQVTDEQVAEFLKDRFALVGNVDVTQVKKLPEPPAEQGKPGSAGAHRFEVQTHGTTGVRGWLHEPSLGFGLVPLRFLKLSLGHSVYLIEDTLVNGMGAWVAILVGVVITAFFIPNMLRKGTIDLLLAKPIRRPTLLVYKYLGGLTFIFLLSALTVGGIWLALGLRSGIWAPDFLLTIFILTFFFAILYSVSTFFGVLTRSAIVAILMTCGTWFFLWLAGTLYTNLEVVRTEPAIRKHIPDWVYTASDTIHAVLPRTKDLDFLTTRIVSRQVLTESEVRAQKLDRLPEVHWGESLTVSGVFIAVMLGLSCWWFVTRDY